MENKISPDEWTIRITESRKLISHLAYTGELCYMCPKAKKNRKTNLVECRLNNIPCECMANQMFVLRILNKSEEYYINEKNKTTSTES